MAMITPDRRATAVHEAGHALAHYLFSIPFTVVSILPDDESFGRCRAAPEAIEQLIGIVEGTDCETDPADYDCIIDAHLIAWYAGPAADSRYTGRPFLECLEGQSDADSPLDLVFHFIPNEADREQYIRTMQRRALNLVADPTSWQAIAALADALEIDHEINGVAAADIITGAMTDSTRTGASGGDRS